jgi:hypothetical protein
MNCERVKLVRGRAVVVSRVEGRTPQTKGGYMRTYLPKAHSVAWESFNMRFTCSATAPADEGGGRPRARRLRLARARYRRGHRLLHVLHLLHLLHSLFVPRPPRTSDSGIAGWQGRNGDPAYSEDIWLERHSWFNSPEFRGPGCGTGWPRQCAPGEWFPLWPDRQWCAPLSGFYRTRGR